MPSLLFIRQKHTPYGGAERYLQRLADAIEKWGIETEILRSSLPKWLPSWVKALLFDREVCREKALAPPDLLYFSLDRISCPDIYRAGDGVHRSFLRTKGFTLNPLHLSYLWLEKRTFRNARLIIANSRLVKRQIMEEYHIPGEKIRVIYNGIPLPPAPDKAAAKQELAAEFGLDPRRPLLLFVGSGFERKGVRELLELLAALENDAHTLIVGKEKHLASYRELAGKLGIESRVTFTGPREEVERFYAAADLFLFPTRYEPFSNVVLEALAHGCVALTTLQNGASEILPPGWVMEHPSDRNILPTLTRLLSDYPLLDKEQRKARKIAEAYPIERNVEEFIELLKETAC
jgi:UDP-glucose:(heptosyl)LPS alpha-1,3-glucosyltransferase